MHALDSLVRSKNKKVCGAQVLKWNEMEPKLEEM